MTGPKASIDQCSNCVYWERFSQTHGICHIISYPWQFKNQVAYITEIGVPAHYGRTRTPADADINGAVATTGNFFCILYKVGKAQ